MGSMSRQLRRAMAKRAYRQLKSEWRAKNLVESSNTPTQDPPTRVLSFSEWFRANDRAFAEALLARRTAQVRFLDEQLKAADLEWGEPTVSEEPEKT